VKYQFYHEDLTANEAVNLQELSELAFMELTCYLILANEKGIIKSMGKTNSKIGVIEYIYLVRWLMGE
jgi:hypothetical protein